MIEINNLSRIKIDKRFFKKVIQRVLKGERKEKKEISLAFINPAKIRKLNKKYRKKDKSTDILSYIYNINSGEIVICPQKVKKNAKIYKSAFKKELSRVLIHGILHLLGWDHEKSAKKAKDMEGKENYYLSQLKFKN
jgi:probable rRNA maturation factor